MSSGDSENYMSGSSKSESAHLPVISVCMITYNHGPFIARAIEGVMEQDSPYTFELVIGEDCSTDNTRQICLEYERLHPGIIRVLESSANLGITGNFTRTLAACRGRYIALCEGDDFWTSSSKLHSQVSFLEKNPEYGMVSGRVEMVDEQGLTPADTSQLEEQLSRMKREPGFFDLLEYNMINTPTVCLRREVLRRLVDEAMARNIWFCVDYWFWLRIAVREKIYLADEVFASYRVHSDGASRQGSFLRRRMPWIRYDAAINYVREHMDITGYQKAVLFKTMAAVAKSRASDSSLRIRALMWCVRNPLFFIARLRQRMVKQG